MLRISKGYVTKFAPHLALKIIAGGKLTFDERVVLHRVVNERGRALPEQALALAVILAHEDDS